MPTTEVILTAKVAHLGAEADLVKVKAGYARNFLLPQGLAIEKSSGAVHRINVLKKKRAEREAAELNDAQDLARRIGKLKLSFELETGETGKAFGSVTAADIADKIRAELGGNIEIDRHRISPKTIKDSGKHDVEIKLHHDITATVTVTIGSKTPVEAPKPEGEEARCGVRAAQLLDGCERMRVTQVPVPIDAAVGGVDCACLLIRGVLLPLADDAGRLGYVHCVLNWKQVLDRETSARLCWEMGAALLGQSHCFDNLSGSNAEK